MLRLSRFLATLAIVATPVAALALALWLLGAFR